MKRMIDNKEFDTLKNKVDNIKDIPTITIDVSQMTDESHAQLTDEQYEIIENNSFINVVFPNGTSCGFNRFTDAYEGYHLAMCSGDTSSITYFTASIDSSTKIATIAIGEFSGGKTQYQHNLVITNSNFGYHFTLTITNDSNTAINDVDKLNTYLGAKGYTTSTKLLKVSGGMNADNTLAVAVGMYLDGVIKIQCLKSNGTTDAVVASNNGSVIKDENIIEI